jgi:hypothetical protein
MSSLANVSQQIRRFKANIEDPRIQLAEICQYLLTDPFPGPASRDGTGAFDA